jgi:uncharacterized protein (DUF58 family)
LKAPLCDKESVKFKKNLLSFIESKMQKKASIFIVPTCFGLVFTGILFTIFLIGLTYTNNMTLIIAFWMLAVFLIQMLKTHRQIKDFSLIGFNAPSSHAKQENQFRHKGDNNTDIKFEVLFQTDFISQSQFYKRSKRGITKLEKLKVISLGTFALFKSWKYFSINERVIFYPEKIEINHFLKHSLLNKNDKDEEFSEHLKYTSNLSAKRINWKVFAKTDDLLWKKFESSQNREECIDIELLEGAFESRLKEATSLCYLFYQSSISWSVKYKNHESVKASTKSHLKNCLEYMASL